MYNLLKIMASDTSSPAVLDAGNVIRFSRSGLYDHYGIYIGNLDVIHFSDGIIKQTSLREFSDYAAYDQSNDIRNRILLYGSVLYFMSFSNMRPTVELMGFNASAIAAISKEECVNRAKAMLNNEGYNVLFNNCEHFAVWCRTGVAESSQAFGSKNSMLGAAAGASITRIWGDTMCSSVGMRKIKTIYVD